MKSGDLPCEAYLYRHSAAVVRQASQSIFAKYEVRGDYSGSTEFLSASYFHFRGEHINPLLLMDADVVFWVEEQGSEKCILYLSVTHRKTGEYMPAMRHAVITKKLKDHLSAIDTEGMEIANRKNVAEQYQRIFELDNELQSLYDDLWRLETYTPNATTQINQINTTIRIKKAQLMKETLVLEQLKKHTDS